MLFKSIQSISSIKSSTNNKSVCQINDNKQSSNNVALLGLVVDLAPLLNVKLNL